MNGIIAVAQAVIDEPWEPPMIIPKDDSPLVTTLVPLLGLLVAYGMVLLLAATGRTP